MAGLVPVIHASVLPDRDLAPDFDQRYRSAYIEAVWFDLADPRYAAGTTTEHWAIWCTPRGPACTSSAPTRRCWEHLKRRGTAEIERCFVVHRTMCDVRWLDPAIDPNGRKPGWSYLGDPRAANVSPAGLARFFSLRSWLSQWSYELSNAKGARNAARIRRTPVLQVENGADDAVPASHNPIIREALATPDKEYVRIADASHYYRDRPVQMRQCFAAVIDWSRRKNLLRD